MLINILFCFIFAGITVREMPLLLDVWTVLHQYMRQFLSLPFLALRQIETTTTTKTGKLNKKNDVKLKL